MFDFIKKEKSKKIHKILILFSGISPSTREKFSELVNGMLLANANINLNTATINELTNERIYGMRDDFREPCILILVYKNILPYEYYYKLGIAHAFDTNVILINFAEEGIEEGIKRAPKFARFNFYLRFDLSKRSTLPKIFESLKRIIEVILINDARKLLYYKAIEFHEKVKENHEMDLDVFSFHDFSDKVASKEIDFLMGCFIRGDNEKLYFSLLRKLFSENQFNELFLASSMCMDDEDADTLRKDPLKNQSFSKQEDAGSQGMQPNVFNIDRAVINMSQQNTDARSSTTHQHGEGDNVAGDSVQGDKHS